MKKSEASRSSSRSLRTGWLETCTRWIFFVQRCTRFSEPSSKATTKDSWLGEKRPSVTRRAVWSGEVTASGTFDSCTSWYCRSPAGRVDCEASADLLAWPGTPSETSRANSKSRPSSLVRKKPVRSSGEQAVLLREETSGCPSGLSRRGSKPRSSAALVSPLRSRRRSCWPWTQTRTDLAQLSLQGRLL